MAFCNDLPPYSVFDLFVFEGPSVVAQGGVVAFAAVFEGAAVVVETCFKLIVCYSCMFLPFGCFIPLLLLGRPRRSSGTVRSVDMSSFVGS